MVSVCTCACVCACVRVRVCVCVCVCARARARVRVPAQHSSVHSPLFDSFLSLLSDFYDVPLVLG